MNHDCGEGGAGVAGDGVGIEHTGHAEGEFIAEKPCQRHADEPDAKGTADGNVLAHAAYADARFRRVDRDGRDGEKER